MNAYELADELENKPLAYGNDIQEWLIDAANMLRQQADEKMELTGKFVRLADENNHLKDRIAELEKQEHCCPDCGCHFVGTNWFELKDAPQVEKQSEPLTEEDAPFQKVAPKEVADAIDAALGLRQSEPVAWWDGKDPNVLGLAYHQNDYCPIPLYTTPQTKPLSDDEIQKIIDSIDWNTSNVLIRFARAIEAKVRGQ